MTTLNEWLEEQKKKVCWYCRLPVLLDDEIEFDYQGIMYHKGCKKLEHEMIDRRVRERIDKRVREGQADHQQDQA